MLPPKELYGFRLLNTPFMYRMNDIPGLLGAYLVFLLYARLTHPRWPPPLRWLAALVWLGMFQTADTLHSMGHILSARRVGVPVSAIVSRFGFQITDYPDHAVTPEQHIGRAVGGPLLSGGAAISAYWLWRRLRRIPLLGPLAEAWFALNAMAVVLSLSPAPRFDGAVMLKNVVTIITGEAALGEEAVQGAGFAVAGGALAAAPIFALRGKPWLAAGCIAWALAIITDLLFLRGRG